MFDLPMVMKFDDLFLYLQLPDCCYSEQTGEANIKGVITWNSVIANSVDTQQCPYGFYPLQHNDTTLYKASRVCLPNFKDGAQWQTPNTSACAYKTKTTLKLQQISQVGSIPYANIFDSYDSYLSCKFNNLESLHLVRVSRYQLYTKELRKVNFF